MLLGVEGNIAASLEMMLGLQAVPLQNRSLSIAHHCFCVNRFFLENAHLLLRIAPDKDIDSRRLVRISGAREIHHEEEPILAGAASAGRCAQQDAGRVAVAMVGAPDGRPHESRPVVGHGGAV